MIWAVIQCSKLCVPTADAFTCPKCGTLEEAVVLCGDGTAIACTRRNSCPVEPKHFTDVRKQGSKHGDRLFVRDLALSVALRDYANDECTNFDHLVDLVATSEPSLTQLIALSRAEGTSARCKRTFRPFIKSLAMPTPVYQGLVKDAAVMRPILAGLSFRGPNVSEKIALGRNFPVLFTLYTEIPTGEASQYHAALQPVLVRIASCCDLRSFVHEDECRSDDADWEPTTPQQGNALV
jgi:hypothetical protein